MTLEFGEVLSGGEILIEAETATDLEVDLGSFTLEAGATSLVIDIAEAQIAELSFEAAGGAVFSLASIGLDLDPAAPPPV